MDALGKVKTWDTITLHNGTFIHGDILRLELPSMDLSLLRDHLVGIEMQWSPSSVWGLVGSLVAGSACNVLVTIVTHKRKEKTLGRVDREIPRTAEGDVLFPLVMAHRNAETRSVDRILVRRAGSANGEPIYLSNIKSIKLSYRPYAYRGTL